MEPQQPGAVAESGPKAVRISARKLRTPVGVLLVAASDDAVLYLELPRRGGAESPFESWLIGRDETPALSAALTQLRAYFAGKRCDFDLPVYPSGTAFQKCVWHLVAAIPYGQTISYGSIAEQLGSSPRAVGAAVGANPIPIIIPCHRVIGADSSLTGYGGGLRMKIWLLRHEGALLA